MPPVPLLRPGDERLQPLPPDLHLAEQRRVDRGHRVAVRLMRLRPSSVGLLRRVRSGGSLPVARSVRRDGGGGGRSLIRRGILFKGQRHHLNRLVLSRRGAVC